MRNREIARKLRKIACSLEILDSDKPQAAIYHHAASVVSGLSCTLADCTATQRKNLLSTIAPEAADQIEQMLQMGDSSLLSDLSSRIPEELFALLAAPGITTETVKTILKHTNINSFETLYDAAKRHQLRRLPGIRAKLEFAVQKAVGLLTSGQDQFSLGTVLPQALSFSQFLRESENIIAAEPVGSIRRRKSLVHDIDILAASYSIHDLAAQIDRFISVREIRYVGTDVVQGVLDPNLPFEVILVRPEDYPTALLLTTGSKELRAIFTKGLQDTDITGIKTEAEAFQRLGFPWIPPELREEAEVLIRARDGRIPALIELADLQGDLHTHTDQSDGVDDLETMVQSAIRHGLSYLAITDHSKSLTVSNGLDERRLTEQCERVRELNEKYPSIVLLTGSEVDILKDGRLDFEDDVLAGLDIVVASIHSHFSLGLIEQTDRIIRAMENPYVHIIGHLTGQMLTQRAGYAVDADRIIEAAAYFGKTLEINAHPDRLDITEEVARKAAAAGVGIVINSDAHDAHDFGNLQYGIYHARRAGLTAAHILNTALSADCIHRLKA